MQKMVREYDLVNELWRLAGQWKAILIVALVMAIVFPAFQLVRTTGSDADDGQAVPNKVEDVYSALSDEDREAVEYAVRQEKNIESMKKQLDNSILLNLDCETVKVLSLDYYISGIENASMIQTLRTGYISAFKADDSLKSLRDIISPDSDPAYISELISFDEIDQNELYDSVTINEAANESQILSLSVIIPDDADPEAVKQTVNEIIEDREQTLVQTIGQHSVQLLYAETEKEVGADVINKWHKKTNMLQNLQNWHYDYLNKLSDAQRAAYETIITIEKSTDETKTDQEKDVQESPEKGIQISKKQILEGVLFGILLYVFVFVLRLVFNNAVGSARNAQYYTGCRLLGEYYKEKEAKGLSALLHSKYINKLRWGKMMDPDTQAEKAADAIDAYCKRKKISEFLVINYAIKEDEYIANIEGCCKSKGIALSLLDAVSDIEESKLASADNVIIALGSETKVSSVEKCRFLCKEFGIVPAGVLFSAEV